MKVNALFIHGMWSTSKRMEFWQRRLEAEMPSVAINLDRTNIETTKFSDYVDQTERFVSNMDGDKVVIIGHSMGGLIAQKVENPRVTTRILAAPAAPKGIFAIDNFTQIFSMLSRLNQAFARTIAIPSKFWIERLVFNMHKQLGLNWDYNELLPQSYRVFEQVLFGIPVPKRENVHIFVGSKDKITPPRVQERLANYHSATLRVFPMHDHCSICQSTEVADYISEVAKKQ